VSFPDESCSLEEPFSNLSWRLIRTTLCNLVVDLRIQKLSVSVSDPFRLDADPDPALKINADPDPGST
jgi:hypothetical protein